MADGDTCTTKEDPGTLKAHKVASFLSIPSNPVTSEADESSMLSKTDPKAVLHKR